jgi:hypothetical protein
MRSGNIILAAHFNARISGLRTRFEQSFCFAINNCDTLHQELGKFTVITGSIKSGQKKMRIFMMSGYGSVIIASDHAPNSTCIHLYCDVHAGGQQSTARRLFTAVAMKRNNRAAVFSLRSVPVVTSSQQ